jgi:hypothetical protein
MSTRPAPPSKPPHLARLSFPNSTYIRRNSARFSTGYGNINNNPADSSFHYPHSPVVDKHAARLGQNEGSESIEQAAPEWKGLEGRPAAGFDASSNVSEAYLTGESQMMRYDDDDQTRQLQIQEEEEEESLESLKERGRNGWVLFDFEGEEGSNELRWVVNIFSCLTPCRDSRSSFVRLHHFSLIQIAQSRQPDPHPLPHPPFRLSRYLSNGSPS